VTIFD